MDDNTNYLLEHSTLKDYICVPYTGDNTATSIIVTCKILSRNVHSEGFCLQPLYNFPDSNVCEEDSNLKSQVDKLWAMLTDQNQTYPIVSHFVSTIESEWEYAFPERVRCLLKTKDGNYRKIHFVLLDVYPDNLSSCRAKYLREGIHSDTCSLLLTIAEAVDHLSEIGYIHTSLYPDNILVSHHGNPKILGLDGVYPSNAVKPSLILSNPLSTISPELNQYLKEHESEESITITQDLVEKQNIYVIGFGLTSDEYNRLLKSPLSLCFIGLVCRMVHSNPKFRPNRTECMDAFQRLIDYREYCDVEAQVNYNDKEIDNNIIIQRALRKGLIDILYQRCKNRKTCDNYCISVIKFYNKICLSNHAKSWLLPYNLDSIIIDLASQYIYHEQFLILCCDSLLKLTDARGINNILISHNIPQLISDALSLHIQWKSKEIIKALLSLLNNLLAHTSSMGRIHVNICIDYNIHLLLIKLYELFPMSKVEPIDIVIEPPANNSNPAVSPNTNDVKETEPKPKKTENNNNNNKIGGFNNIGGYNNDKDGCDNIFCGSAAMIVNKNETVKENVKNEQQIEPPKADAITPAEPETKVETKVVAVGGNKENNNNNNKEGNGNSNSNGNGNGNGNGNSNGNSSGGGHKKENSDILLYVSLCLSPLIQGVPEDQLPDVLPHITNVIQYFLNTQKDNKDIMCEIAKMVLLLTSKSEPAKIALRDSNLFHNLLSLCIKYLDCERYIYLFMEFWQNISTVIKTMNGDEMRVLIEIMRRYRKILLVMDPMSVIIKNIPLEVIYPYLLTSHIINYIISSLQYIHHREFMVSMILTMKYLMNDTKVVELFVEAKVNLLLLKIMAKFGSTRITNATFQLFEGQFKYNAFMTSFLECRLWENIFISLVSFDSCKRIITPLTNVMNDFYNNSPANTVFDDKYYDRCLIFLLRESSSDVNSIPILLNLINKLIDGIQNPALLVDEYLYDVLFKCIDKQTNNPELVLKLLQTYQAFVAKSNFLPKEWPASAATVLFRILQLYYDNESLKYITMNLLSQLKSQQFADYLVDESAYFYLLKKLNINQPSDDAISSDNVREFVCNHFKIIGNIATYFSDLLYHLDIVSNMFLSIKKFSNEPKILSEIFHIFIILLGKNSEVESSQLFGESLQEFIEILTSTTEKVVDPSNPLLAELKKLYEILLGDKTFNDYNEKLEGINKKYLGSSTSKANETLNPETVEVK